MSALNYFTLGLVILTAISYHYARLHKHVRHRFSWPGFLTIIAVPTGYVIYLTALFGVKIIWLFILSSVIGWVLEYGFGKVYYNVEGSKLWRYTKWSIQEYTSWLVLPVWGIGGVILWSLGKIIGL